MPRTASPRTRRPRISIDVQPELRRRLRVAAAKCDVSVREYVIETLTLKLREDLGEPGEETGALTARTDPVLAELWDNPRDAEYDRR
ncbi:MAG: hypothetical protein HY906_26795 [Deltaproteobacteria bacterium]|nr:hypothetical protein [Deltaproteobacteria bacterium]